jgi:ketosteroid isomerase-like protein
MNKLKMRLPAFLLLCLIFSACNKPSGPKAVAAEFVKDLYAMNFDEAAEAGTASTKTIILKNQKSLQDNGTLDAERAKRTEEAAETSFGTKSLTEKISGNEADVTNDAVAVHLKLEDGEWKVAADDAVVESILFRETYLANAKQAWEQLKSEYDKRSVIVKDYLSYKTNATGATKETQILSEAFNSTSTAKDNLTYIRNQDRLTQLLEKNVLPTFTASSDITLNYILQLSTARDNINAAKKSYNEAARRARNKDFLPVPE